MHFFQYFSLQTSEPLNTMRKNFLLALLVILSASYFLSAQTTYYLYSSVNIPPLDMTDLSNWNTSSTGGGSNPASFSNASDIWDLNGVYGGLTGNLTIAGTLRNSGIMVPLDVQGQNLTLAGVVEGTNIRVEDLFPGPSTATIEYADPSGSDILQGTYTNIAISGAGTFTATGNDTIDGTLSTSGSSAIIMDMSGHDLIEGSSFAIGTIGSGGLTIETQSVSSLPIPEDITWPSGTKVLYNETLLGQYIVSGDYDSLQCEGSSKIISASDTVAIRNKFENSTDITLEANNSSYAQIHSLVTMDNNSTGTINKQHYFDVTTAKYFHRGTALDGADLQDLNNGQIMNFTNDNTGSVWEWDAANSEWTDASATGNAATTAYAIFAGTNAYGTFLISGSGTADVSATNLHHTDVTASLEYDNTGDPADFVDAVIDGWNFVANPFLGNYDFANHNLNGSTAGAIADYYYVFNGTNYSFYQVSSGTGTGGSAGTGSPATQYIAPGQGVWFRTNNSWSGTTTFEASNIDMSGSAQMYRTTATPDILKLRVTETSSNLSDEVLIRFDANATDAEDFSLDVPKKSNPGNVPNTYVKLGNATYALCAANFSRNAFPLHLSDPDHNQAMEFSIIDNSLTTYNKVFLEDKKNNSFTELTAGNYSFANDTVFGTDRFVLHFQNTVGLPEGMIESTNYDVYYGHGALNFVLPKENFTPTTGFLFNLQGQLIYSFDVDHENTSVDVPQLSTGIYLLSLEGDTSGARKIYINN